MIQTTRRVGIYDNPRSYFHSFPNILRKNSTGGWSEYGLTSDELKRVSDPLLSEIKTSRNTMLAWTGSFVTGYLGSYLEKTEGEPPSILVKNFHIDRVKSARIDFAKAKREGHIVVNNYDSDLAIEIRAQAPLKSSKYVGGGGDPYQTFSSLSFVSAVPDPRNNGKTCFSLGGQFYTDVFIQLPYGKYVEETSADFGSYDIEDHCSIILQRIRSIIVDGSIVTTALAKANAGQFDVLSNLAEAPETIESIFNGIQTIFAMYRDARNRDFRLQNTISRLRQIQNPTLNQRKLTADLMKASSDVWLTYRLGIKPVAGMVEDLIDLHFRGIRVFERYRETRPSGILDVSYDSPPATIAVTERAFIKRKYDLAISALGFPPIGAAWEVVPLSFVLDRYVNIGEWLVAHLSPDLSVEQGATYSWKMSGTASSTTYTDGVSYQVHVSYYQRRTIDPYRYCGLNYPPTRTRDQKLDHLALVWNLILDEYVRPSKTRTY